MSFKAILTALALCSVALLLAGCSSVQEEQTFQRLGVNFELDLDWAQHGEVVEVKLLGDNSSEASVTVAGVPAAVVVHNGNQFAFTVPHGIPTGRQPVVIELDTRTLLDSIQVLGPDVVDGEIGLVLQPGSTVEDVRAALEDVEFQVLEGPYPLGGTGPCSGQRLRIRVDGMSTGRALTLLTRNMGEGTIWSSNPLSDYSSGTVDHLAAVGATSSRLRGIGGAGTTIAVLDTGVSPHVELGSRLLDGYDFIDEGTSAADEFSGGHGTPIAVLAAGTLKGVAPEAEVLPVRVCDENGSCFSDDVLAGVCYALATADERGGSNRLVLNMSLGGDTPIPALREVMQYALGKGALIAASGGNQGNGGPKHYPAAFDLEGVLAVAALRAGLLDELTGNWEPASFSTRGDYLDISAPGTDLTSGSNDGLYRSDYTGTSYSTALVAGALAVWREAHPELTPAEIEARVEAAAKPLPYPVWEVGAGMLDLSQQPN